MIKSIDYIYVSSSLKSTYTIHFFTGSTPIFPSLSYKTSLKKEKKKKLLKIFYRKLFLIDYVYKQFVIGDSIFSFSHNVYNPILRKFAPFEPHWNRRLQALSVLTGVSPGVCSTSLFQTLWEKEKLLRTVCHFHQI